MDATRWGPNGRVGKGPSSLLGLDVWCSVVTLRSPRQEIGRASPRLGIVPARSPPATLSRPRIDHRTGLETAIQDAPRIFVHQQAFPGHLWPVRRLTPHGILVCSAVLASAAYAAGPVVLVVGPPGSGRSTQAAILKKDLGMAVISADEVIARNPRNSRRTGIQRSRGWTRTWIPP